MAETATPRKHRRLRRFLAILVIGPLITLVSLPTLLSTSPARNGLVGVANRYLAPSRLDVAELRLSWFGSLELEGLSLRDAHGKRLLAVSKGTLDRSLLELLFDRSGPSTLTLEEPALDVTRRPDGSIDLVDLLPKRRVTHAPRPRVAPQPSEAGLGDVDLTLKVVQGSLRIHAPELIEPITVDRYDMTIQTTVAPGPVNLRLRMEKGSGAGAASVAIDGTFDARMANPAAADLSLNILARHWPFAARVAGVAARGALDGQLAANQKAGRWDLKGDTRLLKLDATGGALGSDRLRLDLVTAIWDVVQNPGLGSASAPPVWDVRRLKVISPVATLAATGPILGAPGTGATVEGRVDLAALARQLPHALRIRDGLTVERGEAGMRVSVRYEADAQSAELTAQLSDLIAHDAAKTVSLRSPAKLAARATQRGSNLTVEQLELTSGFLRTSGTGDLDQGIKVTGSLDLGALQAQLRDLMDFGAVELAGQGEYALDYRRAGAGFAAGLNSEFHGLDVKGLTAEPVRRGAVRLQAAVNGPSTPSGVPQGLGELKVGVAAGQIRALATATIQGGATALHLDASGPLTLSEQIDGVVRGDVKFQGTWQAPALEIGALRLQVHPANAPAEANALDLAVRGRFDQAAGEVILAPIAGTPLGALSLAPQGLRISGLGSGQPAGSLKVEGNLLGDLAALDQLIAAFSGSARYDLAGAYAGKLTVQPRADGRLQWGAWINSADLSLAGSPGQPRSQEGPVALAAQGGYLSAGGQLSFDELRLATRYASFDAKGQVADATGRRVADLQGSLAPNWKTLNAMFVSAAGPGAGAQLRGGAPRPFRIKGPLAAASLAELLKGLDVELGVDLAGAQAYGMNLGPAPLVVLCDGGRTLMAPIVTTLNNGKVDIRPELGLNDPRGLVLRLLPGSTLQEVEINDQVSHDLLSYIAPVLEEATQVHGHLSVTFARADFPIGGDADRTMAVNAAILFDNVVFGPGPLGGELLSLAGKGANTSLRINQTLQLAVANRRIHQSGLVIPLNKETGITVKGSVGFDQTLALRADVPVNPSLLGRDKMLQKLVSGTSIPVPVGGTLTHPKVDRQALSAALREVTRSIIKRNGEGEAKELLKRFIR